MSTDPITDKLFIIYDAITTLTWLEHDKSLTSPAKAEVS